MTIDPIETLARGFVNALADATNDDHITDEEWNDPDPEATAVRDAFRINIRTTLSAWLNDPSTVDTIARTLSVKSWGTAPEHQREAFRYGARAISAGLVATLTAEPANA